MGFWLLFQQLRVGISTQTDLNVLCNFSSYRQEIQYMRILSLCATRHRRACTSPSGSWDQPSSQAPLTQVSLTLCYTHCEYTGPPFGALQSFTKCLLEQYKHFCGTWRGGWCSGRDFYQVQRQKVAFLK